MLTFIYCGFQANGQEESNKPAGMFSFGVQSSNSQAIITKDPATKSENLFTFGSKVLLYILSQITFFSCRKYKFL